MKLLNDNNVYAILALNTNLGVAAESKILTGLGIKPLKVLIGYYKGARGPSYLVDDVTEALAVAWEYKQESIVILGMLYKSERTAWLVDVITGNILHKGVWHNNGTVEPDGWTLDGDTYYTIE